MTVDEIQKAVAEHFGLKQADLLSERRTRAVARPRQVAMYAGQTAHHALLSGHRPPLRRPRPHHGAARGAPHRELSADAPDRRATSRP